MTQPIARAIRRLSHEYRASHEGSTSPGITPKTSKGHSLSSVWPVPRGRLNLSGHRWQKEEMENLGIGDWGGVGCKRISV